MDAINISDSGGENLTLNKTFQIRYPQLKTALDITLFVLLLIIMLSMGCVITWQEVWSNIRRPVGIFIGMTSQFVLLPLVGFGLAHALQLQAYHAIGLLVLTCSPGGTTSNIFTYLCDGDVSLSIVMTTASTILAMGFMPVNLLIYSRSWTDEKLFVPYSKIAYALIFISIPVGIGMLLRWKLRKIALPISKIGSVAGLLAIISTIIMESILYPNIFKQNWQVWISALSLPILGFGVGFLLSCICRLNRRQSRTVAIETGAQNVSLALTVLLLSFPVETQENMSIVPILFSIFVISEGIIFCGGFKMWKWWFNDGKFEEVMQSDGSEEMDDEINRKLRNEVIGVELLGKKVVNGK